MVALPEICTDLAEEHAALDGRVADLQPADWTRPTPAAAWAVRDQMSHLAYFDATATLALRDPAGFAAHLADDGPSLLDDAPGGTADLELGRTVPPDVLLAQWRAGRRTLLDALAEVNPSARVPWYGPAMSPVSFATARLMETWAHGTDVGDTFGLDPVASGRLRHVIHLGYRARAYSFAVHGVPDPGTPVTIEATGPAGDLWVFGDAGSPQAIRGAAVDLALVFTQRRHPADTAVVADGPAAEQWLAIAQAFAGPAGPGRPPSA